MTPTLRSFSAAPPTKLTLVVPPALIADARRRLEVACVIVACLSLLLSGHDLWKLGWRLPSALVRSLIVVLSFGLLTVLRSGRLAPRVVRNLGLAYEALLLPLFTLADSLNGQATFIQVSHLLVLLFPVLVPALPERTMAVAQVAGLTCTVVEWAFSQGPFPWSSRIAVWVVVGTMASAQAAAICRMREQAARGREVGSYTLEQLLGEGGMGEVWRAQHCFLSRPAAVKLIRRATFDHSIDTLKRFRREAQATAMLASPNTIVVYDFGVTDDQSFFYCMELLDGVDLHTLVTRFGPVTPARAVWLLQQVCASLQEAHETGLLHRDVKPANIFACRLGTLVDFVKVLDFGLVKPLKQDDGLTAPQAVCGTPGFMAPEQMKAEALTPAADLYAVGCVGYFLLTGEQVFTSANYLELALQHVSERPRPPSTRSPHGAFPDLDRVLLACLEKHPQDRPESAARLAELLGSCALGDTWTQEEARAWWDTHLPERK